MTDLAVRVRRWSTVALGVACISSSVYAASKVIGSIKSDDAALARFAAAVRETAAVNSWRYEVIGRNEEGLLLYLRRMHFISATEAVEQWQTGALDALVAPAEELPNLLSKLPDAVASGLEGSVTINDQPRRYVFLKRREIPSG
jgi:tripartite-type tricarboxylate transporter receptor subunit TctC